MRRLLLVALVGLAGCSKRAIDFADRACDGISCVDGYACFDGICRPFVSDVSNDGASCSVPGTVAACEASIADCSHGCRTCEDDRWSACLYDCAVTVGAYTSNESCNGRDDDCDGLVDEIQDAPQGCEDRFRDVDGDGFGSGESSCACSGANDGYTATTGGDCNDDDPVIHPGGDICSACETWVAANSDDDGDGVTECGGDCNDAAATAYPGNDEMPFEGTCGDALDNDCDSIADCDEEACNGAASAYTYGRVVTVDPPQPLDVGYAIRFVIDHETLVNQGKALASGFDLRVFVRDGDSYREVARELDVASGWNRRDTAVVIRNETMRDSSSDDVLVVYGGPADAASPSTATGVYALNDRFDGTESTLGLPWVVSGTEAVSLGGGRITLPTTNEKSNPYLDRAFSTLSGLVEFTVGTHFEGDEVTYAVHMHLGTNLPALTVNSTEPTGQGSAALLAWGEGVGFDFGDQYFANAVGNSSTLTYSDLGVGTQVKLQAKVNLIDHTMVVTKDDGVGVSVGTTDPSVSSVDTVRLVAHSLGNFMDGTGFDYIGVRQLPPADAETTVGPEITIGPCR